MVQVNKQINDYVKQEAHAMKLHQITKRAAISLIIAVLVAMVIAHLLNTSKTKYPEPPIFASTTHIRYQEMVTEGGFLGRTITFQTIAPTEKILAFYAQELVERKWDIQEIKGDQIRLGYTNGSNNPAFSLTIAVEEGTQVRTVYVQQVIDGPFSNWPKWTNFLGP